MSSSDIPVSSYDIPVSSYDIPVSSNDIPVSCSDFPMFILWDRLAIFHWNINIPVEYQNFRNLSVALSDQKSPYFDLCTRPTTVSTLACLRHNELVGWDEDRRTFSRFAECSCLVLEA